MVDYYCMELWEFIDIDRKWVLQAAYAYNHLDECPYSDLIYDNAVQKLQEYEKAFPEKWKESKIYPDIFLDKDRAWTYTSSHFPVNKEIKKWYDIQMKTTLKGI